MNNHVRFIDLFAGIGGIRKGFEIACAQKGLSTECVFTSEIKPHAIEILKQNHPGEEIHGDITQIEAKDIPDFDFLLGGFPCQAFSSAGKRLGFSDTRGTLFFDVERILKEKKPYGFVLENVEGLVNHDRENPKDKIGRTLSIILEHLEALGYKVSWRVLNAKYFGVPQERKRIYIVGTMRDYPDLSSFKHTIRTLGDVLETGLETEHSKFIDNLLAHYSIDELEGKSIKDKRGGDNNIHSWDIEMKGSVSPTQRQLLNTMLKERRKKKWAEEYGIDWMDGMPLTIDQIRTFFEHPELEEMLMTLYKRSTYDMSIRRRKLAIVENMTLRSPKVTTLLPEKCLLKSARLWEKMILLLLLLQWICNIYMLLMEWALEPCLCVRGFAYLDIQTIISLILKRV